MDYLVKATPNGRLRELSDADRDKLMADEREVAAALIAGGTITWMWRLPDAITIAIWNAESAAVLDTHLTTLPILPYSEVEVIALAPHPAFPTSLRAAPTANL